MTVMVPVHPDLRELWDATTVETRPAIRHRRRVSAGLLIVLGLFPLGAGVGGAYASVTAVSPIMVPSVPVP